jgi:SAM-dependent methyltransferase
MRIPNEAIPFINLQRSGLQDPIKDFIAVIGKEFDEIKPFLPASAESVLDIGCGLAGIDVLLHAHYGAPRLYLADQNQTDKDIRYGFRPTGSFYNSFQVVSEIMRLNDIRSYSLLTVKTGADLSSPLHIREKPDLIISLLSCGYHYPVDTYLARMVELLSPTGRIILDIRENTDGVKKLKQYFSTIETIRHENKAFRVCARAEARIYPREKKIVVADPKKHREIKYPIPMRWEAVLRRIPEGKALRGAEIGVLLGETAFRILRARPLVTHVMIDPWAAPPADSSWAKTGDNASKKPQEYQERAFKYTCERLAFAGSRSVIHRKYSHEIASTIPDKSLDYVFIDGDHSYEGCKKDIALWSSKVRPGGWIGGHDYGNPRLPGVKQAVDEAFADGVELDVEDTWFKRI